MFLIILYSLLDLDHRMPGSNTTRATQVAKKQMYDDIQKAIPRKYRKGLGISSSMSKKKMAEIHANLDQIVGSGFADFIPGFLKPRIGFNNVSSATLKKYGNYIIKRIMLFRIPIKSAINHAMNIISLGAFNRVKKEAAFDKLFHLGMLLDLQAPGQSGDKMSQVLIEKNEVVNITDKIPRFPPEDNSQFYSIGAPIKPITLQKFVDEGKKNMGDKNFFLYDAFTTNCQAFIMGLLQSQQRLQTADVRHFVYQDVNKIASGLPGYVPVMARFLTDLAATWNKISGAGDGSEENIRIVYPEAEAKPRQGRESEGLEMLKSLRAYPLGDDDIQKEMARPVPIWVYNQLYGQNIRSILDIMDDKGQAIILVPRLAKNVGHWVCVLTNKDGEIEFFDSYGDAPDKQKEGLTPEKIAELGIGDDILVPLLKASGKPVVYNTHKFQAERDNYNTCGRWCVGRLLFKDFSLEDFKKMIDETKLPPDDAITILIGGGEELEEDKPSAQSGWRRGTEGSDI